MLFATLAAKKNVINSSGNRWPHVGDGVELVPPPCDPIATPQAFNLHAEETLYDASTQDQRVPEESLYDGNVPTGRGGNVQEAMYSQPDTSKKNADVSFLNPDNLQLLCLNCN